MRREDSIKSMIGMNFELTGMEVNKPFNKLEFVTKSLTMNMMLARSFANMYEIEFGTYLYVPQYCGVEVVDTDIICEDASRIYHKYMDFCSMANGDILDAVGIKRAHYRMSTFYLLKTYVDIIYYFKAVSNNPISRYTIVFDTRIKITDTLVKILDTGDKYDKQEYTDYLMELVKYRTTIITLPSDGLGEMLKDLSKQYEKRKSFDLLSIQV